MHHYTLSDFDYELPEALIAQVPTAARTDSKLLYVNAQDETINQSQFSKIIDYINPEDLLVFNDTKVIPARLHGCKETGGKVECLVERVLQKQQVLAHIRSSKAPKAGAKLIFADTINVEVLGREGEFFKLQFPEDQNVFALLEQYGDIPLPPYITRAPEHADKDRYQTVYAKNEGAVAAPTAGLHFDTAMLEALKANGVDMAFVTLHVGAGTFQPVRVEDLDQHKMHSEYIEVSAEVCEKVQACRARGGRVIAVGTTVLRSLESACLADSTIQPYAGDTDLFIRPGYDFRCVDGLITNFHLPKSTLLMLVSAFGGYLLIKRAYSYAVSVQMRFFSYGDCMMIIR